MLPRPSHPQAYSPRAEGLPARRMEGVEVRFRPRLARLNSPEVLAEALARWLGLLVMVAVVLRDFVVTAVLVVPPSVAERAAAGVLVKV